MKECPIVETPLGKVKGITLKTTDEGKEVYRYSSLPFAKPPVGRLRFEPPVKAGPWKGVLDGTKHSAEPQQDVAIFKDWYKYLPFPARDEPELDEDCLYLSVYTPTTAITANLPVLFWIYGGAFNVGGEGAYDCSVLSGLHDVVVVAANYRVSVFGFLALGADSDYPGNVGLLDQLMALSWTKENIKYFGGNPENVTIFGQSAGSMSVNYHVVSPMSSGLFHKAISHSGTIYLNGFVQPNGDFALELFKKELEIHENDHRKLIKILKDLPTEKILKAIKLMMKDFIFFTPVIDGKFFPKDVASLSKEKLNPVPYIIGCNNTEGLGISTSDNPKDFEKGLTREACIEALTGFMGEIFNEGLPSSAYQLIANKYLEGKKDDKLKWSLVYGEVYGDVLFVIPTIKSAEQHISNNLPTYLYIMSHTSKYNHDLNFGPEEVMKNHLCQCDHGDDMPYTFGLPLYNEKLSFKMKFTQEEKLLSREWMKYLTNFAKNGDPNVGATVKTNWPKYDKKDQCYLNIQQPCIAKKRYKAVLVKFWKEKIEPLNKSST